MVKTKSNILLAVYREGMYPSVCVEATEKLGNCQIDFLFEVLSLPEPHIVSYFQCSSEWTSSIKGSDRKGSELPLSIHFKRY